MVRERRKDYGGIFAKLFYKGEEAQSLLLLAQMARSEGAGNSRDFGSEGFRRDKSKRDGSTSNVITEKSIFYRDVALIRFKDENV